MTAHPMSARLAHGLGAVLGAVLLAAIPVAAHADDLVPYTVPDANLSIGLPAGWAVVTRDGVQAHAEVIAPSDLTPLHQFMLQQHVYLTAVSADHSAEVNVVVIDPVAGAQRVWSMNEVTDASLARITDEIVAQAAATGLTLTYERSYTSHDQRYVVFSGTMTSGSRDYQQYYTVVNGRMTSIVLYPEAGPVTADQEALLLQIVDAASFLAITTDPEPSLDPLHPRLRLPAILQDALAGALIGGVIAAVLAWRRARLPKTQPVSGPHQVIQRSQIASTPMDPTAGQTTPLTGYPPPSGPFPGPPVSGAPPPRW